MVLARLTINDYSNKVLNMIKIKFDLNDKSEALNKFINLFGENIVEKQANDEYIKKIIKIEKSHLKKNETKTMSLEELDKLCGI